MNKSATASARCEQPLKDAGSGTVDDATSALSRNKVSK